MGCLNGAMLWARPRETLWGEVSRPRTAAGLDKTLSQLWPLVDETES